MTKQYQVTIPYYHRFYVEAETEDEAIELAHSASGTIVGYDDNYAEVEIVGLDVWEEVTDVPQAPLG